MPKDLLPPYMAENYDVISRRYTKQSRAKKLENLGRWLIDAAKYGNLGRAKRLLKAGADPSIGDRTPLVKAFVYQHGRPVHKLLIGVDALMKEESAWIVNRSLFKLAFLECMES